MARIQAKLITVEKPVNINIDAKAIAKELFEEMQAKTNENTFMNALMRRKETK